jgi:PsbP-like protein
MKSVFQTTHHLSSSLLLSSSHSSRAIIFLTLILSIPATIAISNVLSIEHQAMAQKTVKMTNSTIFTTQKSKNFLTYTNSTYGIRIQYPSDWLYKEINSTNIVTFIPAESLLNQTDNSPVFVAIGIEYLPFHNISLDLYNTLAINHLRQSQPTLQIESSINTTIANNPAHKLLYTAGGLKTMTLFTIKGDKTYIIKYAANPTKFPTYLTAAQKMINSFELISNSKPATSTGATAKNK